MDFFCNANVMRANSLIADRVSEMKTLDKTALHLKYEVGDEFLSNHGAGPLTAKIVRIVGSTAIMRHTSDVQQEKEFELPLRFLDSPACGWELRTVSQNLQL
jgi:hypothetical protein